MIRNQQPASDNRRELDRLRRLESLRASEIPVDPIAGFLGGLETDVQSALEALAGAGAALAASSSYANDAAAAAGGVAIGSYYRTGSAVMVRVA